MPSIRFSSRRLLRVALIAGAAALVSACGGPNALRSAYIDYANAHAQVNNQQMLLNLARIHNGHPPYFLQMGPISAQFSFGGGLNTSRTGVSPSGGTRILTESVGLSANVSETPMFNFAPLSGPVFSSVILKPVDMKVFHSLSSQGMGTSMLLRMVAQEVVLKYPNGEQVTLVNRFDSALPDNYGDFLRLGALFDQMKRYRQLPVEADASGGVRFSINAANYAALVKASESLPNHSLKFLKERNLSGTPQVEIVPRTFLGILYAMAFDGEAYDALPAEFVTTLPDIQKRPILRILNEPGFSEPAAATVDYAHKTYVISDRAGSHSNRFTFQALEFLFTQVELNPNQVPTPQLIQVR